MDAVNNGVNINPKSPRPSNRPKIGILDVPSKIEVPKLFDAKRARREFFQIDSELKRDKNEISFDDKVKTPKGILVLLGVLLGAGGIYTAKRIGFLSSVTNFFKKKP